MALETSSGTFQWASTDTVSTVKTITPGFAAKIVILIIGGIDGAADIIARIDTCMSFGIAVNKGTVGQYAVACTCDGGDTLTPQSVGVIRNDCVAIQINDDNRGGTPGRLASTVFGATTVTFTVAVASNVNVRVSWLALGGADITDYQVVQTSIPGSTGNTDITGFGFTPTSFDSFAITFGSRNAGGTLPLIQDTMSTFVGIASSTGSAVICHNDGNTRTTSGSGLSGELVNIDNGSSTDIGARASFNSWIADGIRLNFAEVSSSSVYFILIVKGPQSAIGKIITPTATGAFTPVSGLAFQPKGFLFGSAGVAETTAGAITTTGEPGFSFGVGHATTTGVPANRVSQSGAAGTSGRARCGIDFDKVIMICKDSTANVISSALDITITTTGFTPNKTVGTYAFWLFWLALGDAPAAGTTVITIGNNSNNNYSGLTVTEIKWNDPTNNFNSNVSFEMTKWAAGTHSHGLLRIAASALANIPPGATIVGATIYINHLGGTVGTRTIDLRRLLRVWNLIQVTWNVWATASNWGTAGALNATDRTSTISASATLATTSTLSFFVAWSAAQLIADIQAVVAGTITDLSYHGEDSGGPDSQFRSFISDEGADGLRPFIRIIYSIGSITPFTDITRATFPDFVETKTKVVSY